MKKIGWAILFCAAIAISHAAAPPAARVVILANRDDPDSLRLAVHYAEARSVPAANIVALPMPLAETISWPQFLEQIWQPLQDELVRSGWIDAVPTKLTDRAGRKKYAINGHRIAYLVVCRGVPLRIAHDAALYEDNPPLTANPEFRTNQAAVDSELSLLAYSNYNINAWLRNPLFANDHPTSLDAALVVKTSRLDGPMPADAERLVDNALVAERTGLLGRSYVDLDGPHPEGDQWLTRTADELAALGFDGDVERSAGTIGATARCDAPAFYFGWYAKDLNGPFVLPNFTFPPGAIALHIHSYSARTLRSATEGWCGPFVVRGVTATAGNVYEPYLQLTLRPDLLVSALARGWTWGDAAYYAMPTLSWQGVIIGDPLYRPFAMGFDQQWKNRDKLPPELAAYAVLRKMHLLEAQKKNGAALAAARASMDQRPDLVIGLALAKHLAEAGDAAGAAREIEFVSYLKTFRPPDWALAAEAARLLAAGGQAGKAVEVYKNLLASTNMPPGPRLAWLREAHETALAAKNSAQAAQWEDEMAETR